MQCAVIPYCPAPITALSLFLFLRNVEVVLGVGEQGSDQIHPNVAQCLASPRDDALHQLQPDAVGGVERAA